MFWPSLPTSLYIPPCSLCFLKGTEKRLFLCAMSSLLRVTAGEVCLDVSSSLWAVVDVDVRVERVKLLGPFYIMTQIFKSAPERELYNLQTLIVKCGVCHIQQCSL